MIILLKSIISIPMIFFITGFLINSIYFTNKSLKFDSSIIFNIFVSIIITSFIGLILAQLELYSLFNLVVLLVLASIILYQKYKKIPRRIDFNPTIVFDCKNALIIILILSSILVFFHPFPWIAGGSDPGVYVSTGVNIAKTGSILIHDPLIAQMNISIQEALYDVEPASVYGFISWINTNSKFQFPGYYITDLTSGTITPQFLHIFPVWIAIFYSIFGLPGIFFVNPIFALLSILSLYLIGKRLFSWKVGALAGFILILNFAQIWYARYPFSEIMTQFFIISGLATFIQFNKTSDKYRAIISASLFGLASLTKLDFIFLLFPLGLYLIYIIYHRKWTLPHNYFLVTLFIMLIYSLFDYVLFSKPYVIRVIQLALNSPFSGSGSYKYNSFFTNIEILSLYITKIGFVLALIGILVILLRKDKNEKLLLVLISLMFSGLYLTQLPIGPDPPPWWARRFVPAIFPLYALFAAYAIYEIAKIKRIGIYFSGFLIALLFISLAATSYIIINHSEGNGMVKGVSELAENFKDNDMIIMGPSSEGAKLSTPLYYIFDKKVIFLFKFNPFPGLGIRQMPTPEKVSTGIDFLLNQGYNVYFVIGQNDPYMEKLIYSLAADHKIELINTQEFSYRHLSSKNEFQLPEDKIDIKMVSIIYKISKAKSNVTDDTENAIDIGTPPDFIYIENGFFGSERSNNLTFRWTTRDANIRIPFMERDNFSISIIASGMRSKNVPPANVSIYINEHLAGNFTAREDFEVYNMTVMKDLMTSPYSTLRINSSTWKPSEYIESTDSRELGIAIDKIYIKYITFE